MLTTLRTIAEREISEQGLKERRAEVQPTTFCNPAFDWFTTEGVMSKRPRNNFREDTIDNLLDRLSNMREEILSVERSLERVQAKREQGKDGSGEQNTG
jgi:hypothetical protein